MAEIVQKNMQMTLKELELMEKHQLLSPSEIKKLVKVREEFEYKIVKPKKTKKDFVAYVNYDCQLLKFLAIRRKILRIKEGKTNIDRAIAMRVLKRLRFMTRAWPNDQDLFKLRRNFCKYQNYEEEVTSTFLEEVAHHANDEKLWVKWAQWEMEHMKDFSKARDILLSKATAYHPNSIFIRKECFRLELLFVEFARQMEEDKKEDTLEQVPSENKQKVLDCAVANAIYKDAKKKFKCVTVHKEFYDVASLFTFAEELKDTIFSDMMELYPDHIETWVLIIQQSIPGIGKSYMVNQLLEKLDEAYSSIGISFLNTYLNELLHYLHNCWTDEEKSKLIIDKINSLLMENKNTITASQWMLLSAIARLNGDLEAEKELVQEASEFHKDNPLIKLKELQLKIKERTSDQQKLKDLRRAVKHLESAMATEAWNCVLESLEDPDLKMEFQEKGSCNHERNVAFEMRMTLLEMNDMDDVRRLYKKHYLDTPAFSEYHINMIIKELESGSPHLSHIRLAYETLIKQFGKEQIGLWLSYSKFEEKFGNSIKSQRILKDAQTYLETAKLNHFMCLKSEMHLNPENMTEMQEEKEKEGVKKPWETSILVNQNDIIHDENIESPEREKFFNLIDHYFGCEIKKTMLFEKANVHDAEWESVLNLLGVSIKLTEPSDQVEGPTVEEQAQKFLQEQNLAKKSDTLTLSGSLDVATSSQSSKQTDELTQLLAESDILKPDFDAQKQIQPYWKSLRAIKKERKAEYEKTAGKGWFNMKPTAMTPEVEKSLFLLKNRSALDPKRHYKKSDMKNTPKYFQVAKVQDSAYDFYSDRVPKKQRKKTFAEEIITNEQILKHQKRKYTEIIKDSKRIIKKSKKLKK